MKFLITVTIHERSQSVELFAKKGSRRLSYSHHDFVFSYPIRTATPRFAHPIRATTARHRGANSGVVKRPRYQMENITAREYYRTVYINTAGEV